ncbi:MAG TPA: hypothetical protein VMU67_08065 [Steroidobacteraceae bacterium]|nr:hypothetical protein [Steroidobacteraceae bacterium]
MRKMLTTALLPATALLFLGSTVAHADDDLKCTMSFSMKGWSAFYQTASGYGTIRCSDGRSMHVRLRAKGGGLTVGKSVEAGHGQFSDVARIDQLLGSYLDARAHAGAVNSAQVQVMTNGPVSLALSAQGHGWGLGVSFGELKIER